MVIGVPKEVMNNENRVSITPSYNGGIPGIRPDSVIIDMAIDQGGLVETMDKATTHDDPAYIKHDVRCRTYREMFPYIKEIACKGIIKAVEEDNRL